MADRHEFRDLYVFGVGAVDKPRGCQRHAQLGLRRVGTVEDQLDAGGHAQIHLRRGREPVDTGLDDGERGELELSIRRVESAQKDDGQPANGQQGHTLHLRRRGELADADVTYPNAVTNLYSYDALNRLTNLVWAKAGTV